MTLDPPRAGPQSRLSRLIEDYNPFYLLSAGCMLFGVFALNDSLNFSPIGLRRLLTLIVTLNIYEMALIGLAIFLMRRDIRRDAMLLLVVEAFFLADVGFLNMEVFATNYRIGLLVNGFVLAAAVLKVALVFTAARISLKDARFAFVVTQLAVLFAIPGIFGLIAQRRSDFLPPLAVYAAWWLAGALPVVYSMTVGTVDVFRKRLPGEPVTVALIVSRVLIVLPMLSLIAHLCLANWVYKVTFEPANLAPLLLGFTVLIGHASEHVGSLVTRMRLTLVLPFLAVALSIPKIPSDMIFPIAGVQASPLRIALIFASIVYLEGFWHFRQGWFAFSSAVSLGFAVLGYTAASINDNSMRIAKTGSGLLDKLMPRTLPEWGMVSIGFSFVLLLIGAAVSLSRKPPALDEEFSADG